MRKINYVGDLYVYTLQLINIIKIFIHQLMHIWTALKKILKFTLKQLRYVSVQSHHHQAEHYSSLLKLQLLK